MAAAVFAIALGPVMFLELATADHLTFNFNNGFESVERIRWITPVQTSEITAVHMPDEVAYYEGAEHLVIPHWIDSKSPNVAITLAPPSALHTDGPTTIAVQVWNTTLVHSIYHNPGGGTFNITSRPFHTLVANLTISSGERAEFELPHPGTYLWTLNGDVSPHYRIDWSGASEPTEPAEPDPSNALLEAIQDVRIATNRITLVHADNQTAGVPSYALTDHYVAFAAPAGGPSYRIAITWQDPIYANNTHTGFIDVRAGFWTGYALPQTGIYTWAANGTLATGTISHYG